MRLEERILILLIDFFIASQSHHLFNPGVDWVAPQPTPRLKNCQTPN